MTISEFKAWLDGFEAAMGDAPNPEQWAAIKAKLATVISDVKIVPYNPPGYDGIPRWKPSQLPYKPFDVTCGQSNTFGIEERAQ